MKKYYLSIFLLISLLFGYFGYNNIYAQTPTPDNDSYRVYYTVDLRAIQTSRIPLLGRSEVPGPGDTDGVGLTNLVVDSYGNKICTTMHVFQIDKATAAHIHKSAVGKSGSVVVTLPTPDANGFASACVTADEKLVNDMLKNPSQYYVNVHNQRYPNGAIRGQVRFFDVDLNTSPTPTR